ncbi:hypothetical protein A2215_00120 [Candidatus Berkelbacteria bacterium RIFOXYA2_FULL_43_10]|uniref:Uncharacterized protein n=1 Tax=Candidatus Berkelbacteria bacterium RIFOXYA2_FULL_43_10 TaxID=1797472 RepID=A0A1F5E9J7_9BACT|nr:MAG: hypothetical protein A2215_00120 [Candidatus Berkelbacteria bacterium RIFOXYA2_FULL_43_10]
MDDNRPLIAAVVIVIIGLLVLAILHYQNQKPATSVPVGTRACAPAVPAGQAQARGQPLHPGLIGWRGALFKNSKL